MGDPGRQGGPAEPGVWRERHGQRDDRGERRPGGRCELLHGRSRDRPQYRRRGVRGQAPQHALRTSRRSDLPRARRAAHARAGHGARGGRRDGARRARELPGRAAEPASSCGVIASIDPVPRLLGPADQRAADPRRLGRGRSRPHRRVRPHGAGRPTRLPARSVDLGDVAMLPGLVNAHTHLELSYLRDEVPPAAEFVDWIRASSPPVAAVPIRDRAGDSRRHRAGARRNASACGTASSATSATRWSSFEPLAASRLAGGRLLRADRVQRADPTALVDAAVRRARRADADGRASAPSLAAHAPYSVAPLVFRAIRADDRPRSVRAVQRAPVGVGGGSRVHRTGGGPWRALLEELGAWDPAWVAAGRSPGAVSRRRGFLDARVLAVHGVQMSPPTSRGSRRAATTLVTCPRSNGHTGAGAPPIEDFYESGVRVAVGTDSLASAPDLNVFAELATMRALAPGVPARAARERDAGGRAGARVRCRLRHDRAWQARAADGRRAAAGHRRCGRISGLGYSRPSRSRWIE